MSNREEERRGEVVGGRRSRGKVVERCMCQVMLCPHKEQLVFKLKPHTKLLFHNDILRKNLYNKCRENSSPFPRRRQEQNGRPAEIFSFQRNSWKVTQTLTGVNVSCCTVVVYIKTAVGIII